MLIILLLGIHLQLMLIYGLLVVTGRSRMKSTHLLLACFLPFVGEICLMAAEIGTTPAKPLYCSPFFKTDRISRPQDTWTLPSDWQEVLLGNEHAARALLLKVIDTQPPRMVEVLHMALHAESSEVSHIAAAALMKLHHQHEKAIAAASSASKALPGNMPVLVKWIDAIRGYRESGLVEGASLALLREQELQLLAVYLDKMPLDQQYQSELEMLREENA